MRKNDILLPQLDSDLLRSFLAVAKAGSVSGGAARLLRTQSAVSLQVQKLEEIVAHQLFDRHGRGVSLTARGEQLLPIARQVVEVLDQAVVAMREPDTKAESALAYPKNTAIPCFPRSWPISRKSSPALASSCVAARAWSFRQRSRLTNWISRCMLPRVSRLTILSFTVKPPFGPGRLSMRSNTVVRCRWRCLIESVGGGNAASICWKQHIWTTRSSAPAKASLAFGRPSRRGSLSVSCRNVQLPTGLGSCPRQLFHNLEKPRLF
ncbi:MAG: LysR family transcriptional regulator [Mesorhizobium sp.]|nr:MAG: LysR family transcriptional regulator [Mesorhizobium sp.]RWM83148.1 MAG: LysR family transcriptional regulator [Mesorhizobium sp.]